MWEYYRQAKELVPRDIEGVLDALYEGEGFKIVSSSTEQILGNVEILSDAQKGILYFEGCDKFVQSLTRILDMLTKRINEIGEEDLYNSMLAQVWGCFLLVLVLCISPLLVILARNAITTIQIFAKSVEQKAYAMKKQQKKQAKLIYRMLPKIVVQKMNSGEVITASNTASEQQVIPVCTGMQKYIFFQTVAETFESATLLFTSVAEFKSITKKCSALEV